VVVTAGLTAGLAAVEVNPTGTDVQLKVLGLAVKTISPRVVLAPAQIDLLSPEMASGNGFTVTTTLFDLVHPVAVMVSVTEYVEVTVGLTVGLARVEVNPDGTELQL
jgi:hypothetical protein